jgi:hypothetical protein
MLTSEGFTYFYRSIQGGSPQVSTITCTALATDPKGGLHLAIGTIPVSVYAPTVTFMPFTGFIGLVALNGNVYLQAGGSLGYGNGITWVVTVTPPAPFAPFGTNGQWGAAQLIRPQGNMTMLNGTTWQDANQGLKGLDGQFTYLGDTFPADGNPHQDGDNPGYQLLAADASVTMSPTFWTTIVYQPANAGEGITWVPLWELDWYASGGAIQQGGDWVAVPQQGPVVATNSVATSTLPSWTQVITPAGWKQVGQ